LNEVIGVAYSAEVADQLAEGLLYCDFLRPDKINEDGEVEEWAPKIYEAIKSLEQVREISYGKMG